MKRHLFYKIFGTYLIIIALSLVVVGLLVVRQVKTGLMEKIEDELTSCARIIDLTSSKKEIEEKVIQLAGISDARVTLIDADGIVLADSDKKVSEMDNHLNRPEIQEAKVLGKSRATRFSRSLGVDMFYIALPLKDGSRIKGYVRLSRPLFEVRNSIEKLRMSIYKSIIIIIAISVLIAVFFSLRLTSSIKEMERFTQKIRKGESPGSLYIRSSDEMGQLARNINFMVTELQDRVRAANEEKGKLEAAFASMAAGVLILDSQDKIESSNNSFDTIFGLQNKDIIGKIPLEVFRNIDFQDALDRFKENRTPVSREIVTGAENEVHLEVNISPIHGLPEGEQKTMIFFHDVTRLEKLEKVRVDFVANVTHEIKTPLTAILGFIETLEQGAISDEETAGKFLRIIHKHARRLNRLVDDLLVISDIELGEMKFYFESVSINGIMENTLPVIDSKASKKGITLEKDLPDNLLPIKADRDRLTQIFLNVLDNAVKFTPESGKISIHALDDQKGNVKVEISDTGVGIPKHEIYRLGERFYRVDKARSRELGGTGLGLSIVKHLMIAHKGRVEIQSQLGRGTTVTLIFPVFKKDLAV
ncbi:MAG: ATP-binding protein [Thermodesulfobacteriota bacterium]|nr:ATP-binding protein [Thermodesulfobacteriota bacterium]